MSRYEASALGSVIQFTAVVPKYKQYSSLDAKFHLIKYMEKLGNLVKKDFEATTVQWKVKPKFVVERNLPSEGLMILSVGTNDKLWGFIDRGVAPHILKPKHGRAISFVGTHAYIRKSPGASGQFESYTQYTSRESARSTKYGTAQSPSKFRYERKSTRSRKVYRKENSLVTLSGPWAGRVPMTKPFMWPGIEARHWSEAIREKWRKSIEQSFQAAVMEAIKGFGVIWQI